MTTNATQSTPLSTDTLQIFKSDLLKGSELCVISTEYPYFIGKQVATILGYADPAGAIQKHVKPKHKKNIF